MALPLHFTYGKGESFLLEAWSLPLPTLSKF